MPTHFSLERCRFFISLLIITIPLITLSQIPENDDPCPTDSNPPIDLTSTGNHTGTTCEATYDYDNQYCGLETPDKSVWYTFTPNSADEGYDITLSPVGGGDDAEGPMVVEVYKGSVNQGCTGFSNALDASCAETSITIKIPNSFASGEIAYIKVSTDEAEENCGEFNISIQPGSCDAIADICTEISAAQTLSPSTPIEFDISYNCVFGCLDYASPDLTASAGCAEFADNPTSWFKIDTDGQGQQLFTSVFTNGNWQPVWSIYKGDDCGNLTIVEIESQTCSNEDNTPDLFQVGLDQNELTYWLVVTVDPLSVPITGIDDGTFEVCAATVINGVVCIGDLNGDCVEESLVIEVLDREIEGQPLNGPFCPGEEVTINIEFFFDATETSSDWLSGIVPRFGPGWDIENFDFVTNAPIGNGLTAGWYPEGEECAALIQENVSHLCTYYDENGVFKLCNTFCEPCAECPTLGMSIDDPLPSGYYWVSTGGNADCMNDCSPHEGWGIGSVTAQIEWEFTLRVKEFDNYEDCFANNDLQISFQTFSQGILTCWEDPIGECLIDKSQFGPLWKVDCIVPPMVIGNDDEICHNEITNIPLNTQNGETNTIIVEVEDNPNVEGEMGHTFSGGNGVIQDNLFNTSEIIQIVTYSYYAEDNSLACPGVINELEVTVYPQLIPTAPPYQICEGECIDISPDIEGGFGAPYIYNWNSGESAPTITVCPVIPTLYSVTIEDALGCFGVSEFLVDVKPAVELYLPESIEVCKDDFFDPFLPDYMVCLDILNGSAPYNVEWNAPPGLNGMVGGVFGECFMINETSSSEFAGNNGQYVLAASVTDFFGCENVTEMFVNINGEVTLVLDIEDLQCGETEVDISATGFDVVGNPITTFLLYGGCPNDGDLGDFLEDMTSTTGVPTFPTQDLLSYTCYTVVAQTAAGCQTMENITIPITEGPAIHLGGTAKVCEGEEAMIWIQNTEDFVSFNWVPDIGNTDTLTFVPDSTFIYFVEAMDPIGCLSQEIFTVTVFAANSPECSDPCENQTTEHQITGIAFSDDNGNGVQDNGEAPLSNVQIKDIDNDFTVFTNSFGVYSIPVESGDVILKATISQGQWTNSEIEKVISVTLPCEQDINFGFVPIGVESDVHIYMSNTITRCDWEAKFTIIVVNENHVPFNGSVEFTFDDKATFFASSINGIQINGNVATFATGPVLEFIPKVFEVTLKMPGGTTNLPLLDFNVDLFEDDIVMDSYGYSEQLRCSYDPNDKRTFPDRPGDHNPTLKEEVLHYTIRFQNNGNDTAFHVRIVDVIDANIIKSTIRFIGSSHPYTACISGDSLIVDYENILLVDSMTNYDASQGFISFVCNIDPNVEFDTEINNTADIIFDTNPPIITNTTLNTIVDVLCLDVTTDISESICQGEDFMGFESSGNYQIDLTTDLGCDSTVNLDLDVVEPVQTTQNEDIVCGDTHVFEVMGTEYEVDSSGIYTYEIEGESGCIENIVEVSVKLIPSEEIFETFTICEGETIEYENETYEIDSSGAYEFEVFGIEGCLEKLFNFDVTVISTKEVFEDFTICDGEMIDYGGISYEINGTGIYEFEVISPEGCLAQSLYFDVEVISVTPNFLEYQICENEVVTFEDENYEFDTSGTYSYILQGPSGCDEVELVFDITVNPTAYSSVDTTICEGQSYKGFEESGMYTIESDDPITGCPSIETVNLTVLPSSDPDCLVDNTKDLLLNKVEVFPIPTSNYLFIKSEIDLQNIVVLSTTGKVVMRMQPRSTKEIMTDVSDLPNGFYFVMVETKEGKIMKKAVISK